MVLAKIMPNIEESGYTSRFLIGWVMNSILLCAAPVLGKALQISFTGNELSAVYREEDVLLKGVLCLRDCHRFCRVRQLRNEICK